ncbi:FabD/lysophospholipase-like protein [Pleomassaria siparia CBS 279.74]|uniref:FabD/lysophospholipase-like protein n=1 Tax=Pleomassaria siparia CBS 279.74 TaxID=1314801 RepID=A0A6G1KES8_9PLEO|nr:FabD/lysophospholipase-like protein [Pleomassaria siparia CBS 279.74]
MLQPPDPPSMSRPLSIMTTGTNASTTAGRAWTVDVDEENAWEDLILTLDGGGIRGYASLLILKQLMHEVAECEKRFQIAEGPVVGSKRNTFDEDKLLPCHYFDYMYGTSTGGLIAVMLGRLRMTVPQCLEIYRRVGNDLFGHRRNVLPLATKYHHKPLEKAVQTIVKEYCKHHNTCDGDDWHPWSVSDTEANPTASTLQDSGNTTPALSSAASNMSSFAPTPRICQTICLTATHSGQIDEAHLLRTYNHQYNPAIAPEWVTPYNTGAEKLKIWEVTRATSAAPFFFKMLESDFEDKRGKVGFKDGGIRENNPSYAAYTEHISLRGEDNEPALLLSIGTGRPNVDHDGFAPVWPGPFGKVSLMKKWSEKFAVFKNLLIKYTEGEDRHKMMRTIAKGETRWYKRLNVTKGLEDMKLDNWEKGSWSNPKGVTEEVPGGKTLTRMEQATTAYLTRDRDVSDKMNPEYAAPKLVLEQIAERLVRHRRMREKTKDDNLLRWQTHMGQWLTGTLQDEDAMVDTPPTKSTKSRKQSASSQEPLSQSAIVTEQSKQPIVIDDGNTGQSNAAHGR